MKNILGFLLISFLIFSCDQEDSIIKNQTNNGSYASMLVIGDFLYAINASEMTTFDVVDLSNPIEINKQNVGFDIENIYHSEGILFIGSETTLHIYEIGINGIPVRKSETSYFGNELWSSCDPVIAKDNYAYVTLSSTDVDGPCGGRFDVNELRIYNVSDYENPILESTTFLEEPKGLTIDGNYLFVCEKNTGFSIFDVLNPKEPILLERFTGFESYDVISKSGLLMLVGPTEIRQYDYTDITNIVYLSSIEL